MSMRNLLALTLLLTASAVSAQSILDLNCIDALASVGKPELAGVFSFVPSKDTPNAFADLVARDKKALKKFVGKVEKDLKTASGVTAWDHEVVLNLISLFGSPLAPTLVDPGVKMKSRLQELALAPTLSLEEVAARRRKA